MCCRATTMRGAGRMNTDVGWYWRNDVASTLTGDATSVAATPPSLLYRAMGRPPAAGVDEAWLCM